MHLHITKRYRTSDLDGFWKKPKQRKIDLFEILNARNFYVSCSLKILPRELVKYVPFVESKGEMRQGWR